MRTVDPDLWSHNIKKPPLNISHPLQFGIEDASRLEVSLRRSFRDAMGEFFRNCSVKGVAYTRDKSYPYFFRWWYLITVVVSVGVVMVVGGGRLQTTAPLSLQAASNSFQLRDFPAVGICSYNVFSRSALEQYATYLHLLDKNNTFTLEDIKRNLAAFAAIHTRREEHFDLGFEDFLKKVAQETNVTDILYKLSPDCEQLLLVCRWEARRVPCGLLFAKRITHIGFCCVFNSRYHPMDRNNSVFRTRLVGEDSGLSVVLREDPGDITQLRRPLHGFHVLLFDTNEFPAEGVGVVTALSAATHAVLYGRLRPRRRHILQASPSPERRWSWCVGRCRWRAWLSLCGCAPPALPPLRPSAAPHCSLRHLACLHKHNDKLSRLYPEGAGAAVSEEVHDSIECECGGARVRPPAVHAARALYRGNASHGFCNEFLKGVDLTNTTVVHLFYSDEGEEYLLLTNVPWFDNIAETFSHWMLSGATVITVVEGFFFYTCRWWYHFHRRLQMELT